MGEKSGEERQENGKGRIGETKVRGRKGSGQKIMTGGKRRKQG